MRSRLFASAAASALSAAFATAADPAPLPAVGSAPPRPAATAPALPAIPIVGNAQPPSFLPGFQPGNGAPQQPMLPVVPAPRSPGDPAPMSDPPKTFTPGPASPAMPMAAPAGPAAAPIDMGIQDDHLGPWNTFWVSGGYNYLWIKDARTAPTLLTGNGNTLIGGSPTSFGGFSGMSLDGGLWLNETHTVGVSFGGFLTEQRSTASSFSSDGSPGSQLLARPFFNTALGGFGANDNFIVAAPGRYAGSFSLVQGAHIDGAQVNLMLNTLNTTNHTFTFVTGFRYFDLDEYLTAYQTTQGLNGNTIPFFGLPPVTSVAITDRIRTRNQFYGAQVGGDGEYRFGPMFLDYGLKAALGPVHQVTEISGQTVSPSGGGPGGFLAVGAIPNGNPNGNVGRSTTNNFAVLADASVALGVQITSHARISFGYQFIYLNDVARPSAQINTVIDPRLVPTSVAYGGRAPSSTALGGTGTQPLNPFERDDFFVHTLKFMLDIRY